LSWDLNATAYGKAALGRAGSADEELRKREAAAAAALKK
jgi:hypothetical protein